MLSSMRLYRIELLPFGDEIHVKVLIPKEDGSSEITFFARSVVQALMSAVQTCLKEEEL